jgi:hypothetical protein
LFIRVAPSDIPTAIIHCELWLDGMLDDGKAKAIFFFFSFLENGSISRNIKNEKMMFLLL